MKPNLLLCIFFSLIAIAFAIAETNILLERSGGILTALQSGRIHYSSEEKYLIPLEFIWPIMLGSVFFFAASIVFYYDPAWKTAGSLLETLVLSLALSFCLLFFIHLYISLCLLIIIAVAVVAFVIYFLLSFLPLSPNFNSDQILVSAVIFSIAQIFILSVRKLIFSKTTLQAKASTIKTMENGSTIERISLVCLVFSGLFLAVPYLILLLAIGYVLNNVSSSFVPQTIENELVGFVISILLSAFISKAIDRIYRGD